MEFSNEIIEAMILDGSAEVSGLNAETGEITYALTDKVVDAYPELFAEIKEYFYQGVLKLWEMGLIEIDFDKDEPLVVFDVEKFTDEVVEALDSREKTVVQSLIKYIG